MVKKKLINIIKKFYLLLVPDVAGKELTEAHYEIA